LPYADRLFFSIFNALFLLYSIIQIREVQEATAAASIDAGISNVPIHVLTTIIPIVIGISEIAYIGLGWKIYHEFGWKVYKFLGADRRIKKMYADYQVYECLVKFDVFFWVGFSVQFIWLVLQGDDWEYYVTCAALPLSVVLLVEGHLAARYENKWMMATFMSGCVGAMIYFIYKVRPPRWFIVSP
jgi:predicted transcriptional regulator with HTH domain